jgi:hypothetical protein
MLPKLKPPAPPNSSPGPPFEKNLYDSKAKWVERKNYSSERRRICRENDNKNKVLTEHICKIE